MLHLGTLVALLAYFWRDVVAPARARLGGASGSARLAGDPRPTARRRCWLRQRRPGGARRRRSSRTSSTRSSGSDLLVIPVILVVGALLLWAGGAGRPARPRPRRAAGIGDAVVIGVAQALALFPGISRSGVTLAAGLFLGLEREAAARFAFLMGIPIIAGAGALEVRATRRRRRRRVELAALAAGMVAAAVSGLLAIGFLLRYLRTHSTGIFIAYRLVVRGASSARSLLRGPLTPWR